MEKSASAGTGSRRENTGTASAEPRGKTRFIGGFLAFSLALHILLYFFLVLLEPAARKGQAQLFEVAFSYREAPAVPLKKPRGEGAKPAPDGLAAHPEAVKEAPAAPAPSQIQAGEKESGTAELSSGSGTYIDDAFALWIAGIQRRISGLLSYPRLARENGIEGTAVVRFTVDSAGSVTKAEIVTSSGSKLLDAEAVRVVRRAAPFPPPAKADAGRNDFSIPVTFTLK